MISHNPKSGRSEVADNAAALIANGGTLPLIYSTSLADVKPERIEWLWRGFVAIGKLSVFEGDPGSGKSTLTLHLAGCVSTGRPLPDGTTLTPSTVLLCSYEDGVGDTLVPRAMAAGADVKRLRVMRGRDGELFTVPGHLAELRAEIVRHKARLVVIDPLSAALSSAVDSYKDADVRRALAPLAQLAEELRVAIVIVRHLTKSSKGRAILAGGGSIGISGAARFVVAVGSAPDNPEERIVAGVKSNVTQLPPSLRYRLASHEVPAPDGGAPIETSRLEWIGPSHITAEDLAAARDTSGDDRSALEEAREWLATALESGPRLVSDLYREASKDAGISQRTLQRARRELGVERHRDGKTAPFVWSLPSRPAEVFSPSEGVLANPANIEKLGENSLFGENTAKAAPTPKVNGLASSVLPPPPPPNGDEARLVI